MNYLIRPLDASDYDNLIALWDRSGLPYRPRGRDSREAIAAEVKRMETCFLGMFDGARMIGAIIGTSDGRKGWINRLAIDPDYRGRRLAGVLIEECEKSLREQGLKVIAALIEDENLPSIAAFKRAGYHYHPEIFYFSKRETDDD
ncbi:MAG: GNAT family N-acetyltransferase [Candidatus Zixiibacteriota bacterium]